MTYKIKKSQIHGVGVILDSDTHAGTVVDQAIANYSPTPWFGTKINHSRNPTGFLRKKIDGRWIGNWYYVTARDLVAGSELTLDYRSLPDYLIPYNQIGGDWVE